ncbi:MAG: threonine ammonia-lyase [Phycisphaerales bacterium]
MTATHAASAACEVSFAEIEQARRRIADGVFCTPCVESPALSAILGAHAYCKLEYQQRTGSFKERGACNALLQLTAEQRARGVIAASAGNHALALAYHGKRLGIPVTVVMPTHAPLVKQRRCRELGARVLNHGATIADARHHADDLVGGEGLTYINGFNDAAIIAGQGTIGIELLEQVPDLEAVVAPIGGAGLIAGIAMAVKHLNPKVRVVGVEPVRCASYAAALAAGRPVRVHATPTLADGLAVPEVGGRAFEIARTRVDEVVQVDEDAIALAILRLAELEKGVVEGAGATPVAAFLAGKLPSLRGKRVALVLCGGNIDPLVFSRVIEHGLAVDGRLVKFSAIISDRPGGLAELASTLARAGASVQEITHERRFGGADVSTVMVQCVVEVRDRGHSEELFRALEERGIRILARSEPGA